MMTRERSPVRIGSGLGAGSIRSPCTTPHNMTYAPTAGPNLQIPYTNPYLPGDTVSFAQYHLMHSNMCSLSSRISSNYVYLKMRKIFLQPNKAKNRFVIFNIGKLIIFVIYIFWPYTHFTKGEKPQLTVMYIKLT